MPNGLNLHLADATAPFSARHVGCALGAVRSAPAPCSTASGARALRAALATCVRRPHGTRGLRSGHPAPDACALGAPGARFGLSRTDLKQVWAIADSKQQGYLGFGEFVAVMQLVSLAQVGNEMTHNSLKREDLINLDPPVMEGLDELLAAPLRSKCLLLITGSVQNQQRRYLVPTDLTVGQFVYVVSNLMRKRIKLSPEKAIFVFVKNTLPPTGKILSLIYHPVTCHLPFFLYRHNLLTTSLMSAIYEESKDEDGFLCMTYSGESTFGSA
ncbi:hypothetical protein ABZP36_011322 [Zizania latifolia]